MNKSDNYSFSPLQIYQYHKLLKQKNTCLAEVLTSFEIMNTGSTYKDNII